MQNYRLASPFVAGGRLATAFDKDSRQTVVFTVGSDEKVYVLHADPISDTDWSVDDLAFPGRAKLLDAGNRVDGTLVVYVVDDQQNVCSNQKPPGGTWQGWQVPAFPTTVFNDPLLGSDSLYTPAPFRNPPLKVLSIIDLKVWYTAPQSTGYPFELDLQAAVLCLVQLADGSQRQIPIVHFFDDNPPRWCWVDPFTYAGLVPRLDQHVRGAR